MADITSPFPNEAVVLSVWDLAKASSGTCSEFLGYMATRMSSLQQVSFEHLLCAQP